MQNLKLITRSSEIDLPDVIEFTVGKQYFYARLTNGNTLSISRSIIINAFRKTKEGVFKKIYFRQFNNKDK